MKKVIISMTVFTFLAGVGCALAADDGGSAAGNIALGARVTTLGVGPELTVGLSDYFTVRAAGHWATYSFDGNTDGVDYDCDLNLLSGLASVEWYPLAGGFHLAAGALLNGNNVDATAKPAAGTTYTFNGVTYTAAQAGVVTGDIDFNSVAPYLGIGWGNPIDQDSNWTFFFDLGVVYQGDADVTLTATGTLASDPTFQANLKQEEKDLEDDLDNFKFYPMLALGVTYKF